MVSLAGGERSGDRVRGPPPPGTQGTLRVSVPDLPSLISVQVRGISIPLTGTVGTQLRNYDVDKTCIRTRARIRNSSSSTAHNWGSSVPTVPDGDAKGALTCTDTHPLVSPSLDAQPLPFGPWPLSVPDGAPAPSVAQHASCSWVPPAPRVKRDRPRQGPKGPTNLIETARGLGSLCFANTGFTLFRIRVPSVPAAASAPQVCEGSGRQN